LSQKCEACKNGRAIDFDITMAFQPIVDLERFDYYGYEALVHGVNGEGAAKVFEQVNETNQYSFDQSCRIKALELASKLNLQRYLSINFMPNAVYEPSRCIQSTLKAAKTCDFPLDLIIFEFTEAEKVVDSAHLVSIVSEYKDRGFLTAIDDFGDGFSGVSLLCDVDVDVVKIDRALIKDINEDPRRQRIMRGLRDLLAPIVKRIVVEGVETVDEFRTLYVMGYRYFQGYFFARPEIETLPDVDFDLIRSLLNEPRYL
jgi:EAL domain-containing protein (putative c-di-GMP-specific phosphodiesterase class I)